MGEVGRSAHELHDVQQVLGVDDDLDGGQDQYDYFSDEANGMTESKVVDLSFNPRGGRGQGEHHVRRLGQEMGRLRHPEG